MWTGVFSIKRIEKFNKYEQSWNDYVILLNMTQHNPKIKVYLNHLSLNYCEPVIATQTVNNQNENINARKLFHMILRMCSNWAMPNIVKSEMKIIKKILWKAMFISVQQKMLRAQAVVAFSRLLGSHQMNFHWAPRRKTSRFRLHQCAKIPCSAELEVWLYFIFVECWPVNEFFLNKN